MKVAVTGATGYLGRHVVAALRNRHHDVVALGRTRPRSQDIEHMPFDLNNSVLTEADFARRGITALIHCAWDFYPRSRNAVHQINVVGAKRLADAAHGLRLVDVSTMSAFDGCRSIYGRAKLEVEEIFLRAGGMVFRPGLIWGGEMGGMMASLQKLSRLPISPTIAGGGELYLVHVEDLAAMIAASLDNDVPARTITAAHLRSFSLRQIITALAKEKSPLFLPVPWPLAWFGLRGLEMVFPGVSLRSDSVTGLVHTNPAPQFDTAAAMLRPFAP